jgi:CubicO group peptidase (beta-lactamase class C family)
MAHLEGVSIDPGITAQLFESQSTLDGEDIGFGLGWVITRDDAGRPLWGHLGGVVGGCSALLIYPDEQLVVALAANLDADWSERPAATVGSLFLEAIEDESAVDMKTRPDKLR